MDELTVDWSTAEVNNGELVVALAAKPPAEWVSQFERTAHLLAHGRWSELKLKKRKILLSPLTPGSEDDVRHFLESVVLEANTTLPREEEGDAEAAAAGDDGRSAADRLMTERLRSFAKPADD